MSHCATCRFWSEMIAMVDDRGTVAMCLELKSPRHGDYTSRTDGCPAHSDGLPVDLEDVPAGQREGSIEFRNKLRRKP